MSLSKLEKETIILYNEAEKEADVFTYNRALIKRLKGLCEKHPDAFHYKSDNGAGGLTFIIPKRYVKINAPRTVSDKQREQLSKNLTQK